MVSTIANGGVYLPPHVLMPARSMPLPKRFAGASQPLQASPFKPGEELPNPLPWVRIACSLN
jgi:hypothetical protein